jgi:D-alanine--poly(phosphoribitol) ligase subunit 2
MRGLPDGHNLQSHGPCANRLTAKARRFYEDVLDNLFQRRVPTGRTRVHVLSRHSAVWNQQLLLDMSAFFREKALKLLESVTETDEVRSNLELRLYECQVLDSIKTVELMVRIEEEFGLKISPAEFERENWATPDKIIADLESRAQVNV